MPTYSVAFGPSFKYSLREYKKRFPSVKDDLEEAIEKLLDQPRLGSRMPGGHGIRKLRVRNRDARKGTRGGYRVLYRVREQPSPMIYFLLIYFKGDQDDVTARELQELVEELKELQSE